MDLCPQSGSIVLKRLLIGGAHTWIKIEGYSDEEIENFNKNLRHNAHLLYKYASIGGIQIA